MMPAGPLIDSSPAHPVVDSSAAPSRRIPDS
jgi:hypothetical protein